MLRLNADSAPKLFRHGCILAILSGQSSQGLRQSSPPPPGGQLATHWSHRRYPASFSQRLMVLWAKFSVNILADEVPGAMR